MPVIPFLWNDRDKDKDKDKEREKERERDKAESSTLAGATSSASASNPSASAFTISSTPSSSSAPPHPPNHPFSPSSFPNSSSTSVAHVTSTTNANTNANASSDSPTSKYHPSRLLRRKASTSAKHAAGSSATESAEQDPLPASSSAGTMSFFDNHSLSHAQSPPSPRQLPSSPRRLPSSPRGGLPGSPRTFFGFESGDKEKDKDKEKERDKEKDRFQTFPRRGSEVKYSQNAGGNGSGLPSPTAYKRSAFVYNGRMGGSDEPVVIIPGHSGSISTGFGGAGGAGDEDERTSSLSNNLAALGLGPETPRPNSGGAGGGENPSSLPKVLDGGIGISSGMGVFGKIAQDQDSLVDTRFTHSRPLTPPDSASLPTNQYHYQSQSQSQSPFYPTALSPPRRPMPKSPRAKANFNSVQQSSNSSHPQSHAQWESGSGSTSGHGERGGGGGYGGGGGGGTGPSTPPSASMMQAISAVGGVPSTFTPMSRPGLESGYVNSSNPRRPPSPLSSFERERDRERDRDKERDCSASPTPGASNGSAHGHGARKRTNSTRPAITAEWLARKPSSGKMRHRPSLSADPAPVPRAASPYRSSPRKSDNNHSHDNPIVPLPTLSRADPHPAYEVLQDLPQSSTPTRKASLDESPKIEPGPSMSMSMMRPRPRTTSFSSTNSDTDLEPPSSDGEVGVVADLELLSARRRSVLSTPSKTSGSASPSHSYAYKAPSPYRPTLGHNGSSSNGGIGSGGGGGYEVQVICTDNRDRENEEEMKWQVTIRRRTDRNSINTPNGPLQLSTNESITQAPASASSINLSLALDQPTGKLVFISFPMDIHATPTRIRRPSTTSANRTPSSNNYNNNNTNSNGNTSTNGNPYSTSTPTHHSSPKTNLPYSPSAPSDPSIVRPSTPPSQTTSFSGSTAGSVSMSTPNGISSSALTRTPSSRRKAPPPWPSPKVDSGSRSYTQTNGIKANSDEHASNGRHADEAETDSPGDVFTPRKSRVTPSKLDGDLLNKVTKADTVEIVDH